MDLHVGTIGCIDLLDKHNILGVEQVSRERHVGEDDRPARGSEPALEEATSNRAERTET
jgi:hypothetical protein